MMDSEIKKPLKLLYVLVFPNNKPIPRDQLHSMLEKSKQQEQEEKDTLSKIAAKNPLNRKEVHDSPLNVMAQSAFYRTLKLLAWISFILSLWSYLLLTASWGSFVHENISIGLLAVSVTTLAISVVGIFGPMTMLPPVLKCYAVLLLVLFCTQFALWKEILNVNRSVNLIIQKEQIKTISSPTTHAATHPLMTGEYESIVTAEMQHTFETLYKVQNATHVTGPAWFRFYVNETCLLSNSTTSGLQQYLSMNNAISSYRENRRLLSENPQFEACKETLSKDVRIILQGISSVLDVVAILEAVIIISVAILLLTMNTTNSKRKQQQQQHNRFKRKQKHSTRYKSLLIFGNSILVLFGGTFLAVCVYCSYKFQLATVLVLLLVASIFFIVTGVIGCTGVSRKNRLLLQKFMILLVVLLVIQVFTLFFLNSFDGVAVLVMNGDPQVSSSQSRRILRWMHTIYDGLIKNVGSFESWVKTYCNTKKPSFDQCKNSIASPVHKVLKSIINTANVVILYQVLLLISNWLFMMSCTKKIVQKEETSHKFCLQNTTITFKEALERYLLSIPQGKPTLVANAKKEFTAAWKKTTGWDDVDTTNDVILLPKFEALTRTLIINRLCTVSKLDLSFSLSKDGSLIYCRVGASEEVLKAEACRIKYKLQFHEAIDPGKEFWRNPVELASERKLLTRDSVKNKLTVLFMKNKIPITERQIYPNETPTQWSARINALQRISKDVEMTNSYKCYCPLIGFNSKEYLFKRHRTLVDTTTNWSLFRTVDQLCLVKGIIDEQYDLEEMENSSIINSFNALHSASEFDLTSVDSLYEMWITFWKPFVLTGEPASGHCVIKYLRRIYPFRQPISKVREYFGEKIALYFCWIGYYAKMQSIPAIAAILVLYVTGNYHAVDKKDIVSQMKQNTSFEGSIGTPTLLLMGLVLVWTLVFTKAWERHNSLLAIKWGTNGFEQEEKCRPQFKGTMRWNPITNTKERYFPPSERLKRVLVSNIILAIVMTFVVAGVLALFLIQGHLVTVLGAFYGSVLGALLQSCLILFNNQWSNKLIQALNKWENYRTETEFEDGLIQKIFMFQIINNFSALLITAFIKKHLFGCAKIGYVEPNETLTNEPGKGNCMHELESLIAILFCIRIVLNAVEIGKPLITKWLNTKHSTFSGFSYDVEDELALEQYENTFEDYTEMVLQFGLMTMFVGAFPLAPIIAYVESTLEIRVDAFKLCTAFRRPIPTQAEDIGTWGTYLAMLSRMAIVTNVGLLIFTAGNFTAWEMKARVVTFFCTTVLALMIFQLILYFVPDAPATRDEVLKRHEFLIKRYVKDDDDRHLNSGALISSAINDLEDLKDDNDDDDKRVTLLNRLNKLYPTTTATGDKDGSGIELTEGVFSQEALETKELEGIEAIREAVRRSTYSFNADDDDDLWSNEEEQSEERESSQNEDLFSVI